MSTLNTQHAIDIAVLHEILQALRDGKRFLVCSHSSPDGDAISSTLAMGMLLEQMGKDVDLISADQVPLIYRGLPNAEKIRTAMRVYGPYDAVILLECSGLARTGVLGLEPFFHINIDHHISGQRFAHINWIDHEAAAVGELIYRLIKAAGATISPAIATCLYTAMISDTGGFRYSSTCATTFAIAHELVQAGANPAQIAQDVFFTATTAKMLLLGAALRNLRREGRMAWLSISHAEMMRACAAEEDTDGIIHHAICIAGIEVAAFLRELPDHNIRVSLRSKGIVNVAAIAERLGGGGHHNAAGCTLNGPLSRAIEDLRAEIHKALSSRRNTES